MSGNRKIFDCINSTNGRKDDHVFDAFKVFAIAQWLKKDFNSTPKMQSAGGAGVSSWSMKKEVKKDLKEQVKNKKEIKCTADEWKSVRTYLINASQQADFANDKETTMYISKELNRLSKIFKSK